MTEHETWERRDDTAIFRRTTFDPKQPVQVSVELWRVILRDLGFTKVREERI
jgi:hypothetical protein